jgi:hypothetical protein
LKRVALSEQYTLLLLHKCAYLKKLIFESRLFTSPFCARVMIETGSISCWFYFVKNIIIPETSIIEEFVLKSRNTQKMEQQCKFAQNMKLLYFAKMETTFDYYQTISPEKTTNINCIQCP